jgi:hypothetical protein
VISNKRDELIVDILDLNRLLIEADKPSDTYYIRHLLSELIMEYDRHLKKTPQLA